MSAATDKIKPSDCVLAFGIPTCKKEFEDAEKDSLGRDLVKGKSWNQYHVTFVSHLERVEPHLVKLGLRIVYGLTLQDFGKLFQDSANKVVILFSHWKTDGDTVEFFDGMATIDEIINVVPRSFEGLIDLTVCHPKELAVKLKNHLSDRALIKYVNKENKAGAWLYFYWVVFAFLDKSIIPGSNDPGATYLQALRKAVEEFMKKE